MGDLDTNKKDCPKPKRTMQPNRGHLAMSKKTSNKLSVGSVKPPPAPAPAPATNTTSNAQPKYKRVVGNRVPKQFFVTSGVGESDITHHAGSYHLALKDAGIHTCNIMLYSSVLPAIAEYINQPKEFVHGEVMDCIEARCDGVRGQTLVAGIRYGWLKHRSTRKIIGGLVCEHTDKEVQERSEGLLYKLNDSLNASIQELYVNGFEEEHELVGECGEVRYLQVTKRYGTALVSLGFVNYEVPVFENFSNEVLPTCPRCGSHNWQSVFGGEYGKGCLGCGVNF